MWEGAGKRNAHTSPKHILARLFAFCFYTKDCKPCSFLISLESCLYQYTLFGLCSHHADRDQTENDLNICPTAGIYVSVKEMLRPYFSLISTRQRAFKTNVLFKLKPWLETNISFVRGIAVEMVGHMCEGRKQSSGGGGGQVGGRKVLRGRSICMLPDRLFWYSKSRLTGILNMADPPLHPAHKETQPHAPIHSPLDGHLPPLCIDPAGLSLSLPLSLWAQLILNHVLIPLCTSCPPSLPLRLHLLLFTFTLFLHPSIPNTLSPHISSLYPPVHLPQR